MNNPIKILLVVPSFPKTSETFIVNKYISLKSKYPNLKLYCDIYNATLLKTYPLLFKNSVLINSIIQPIPRNIFNYQFIALSTLLIFKYPNIFCNFFKNNLSKNFISILKKYYIDLPIIYFRPKIIHFEFGTTGINRMYLKNILHCKMVTSFRGFDLNISNLSNEKYFENIWNNSDGIHVLSQDLKNKAEKRGMPSDILCKIIPPAINLENKMIHINKSMPPPLNLISVGRMDWRKGYEYIIAALALLKKDNIPFKWIVIGDGPYYEPVLFAVYQYNLINEVHFTGSLEQSIVYERLLQSHILIHAAISEGFCNVVLEAQSIGLPIVSSLAGGLKENISPGRTGLGVTPRSALEIYHSIKTLLNNPSMRNQMGEEGKSRVASHFNETQQTKKFQQFYQELQSE